MGIVIFGYTGNRSCILISAFVFRCPQSLVYIFEILAYRSLSWLHKLFGVLPGRYPLIEFSRDEAHIILSIVPIALFKGDNTF